MRHYGRRQTGEKKGKIKYPCSRGIQFHSYKVVGNISGMFRFSCSFRGDALYYPKRGVCVCVGGGVTEWFDEDKNDSVRALTLGPWAIMLVSPLICCLFP